MKKLLKLSSLILVCLTLVIAGAGCGNSNTENNSTTDTNSNQNSQISSSTDTSSSQITPIQVKDLAGKWSNGKNSFTFSENNTTNVMKIISPKIECSKEQKYSLNTENTLRIIDESNDKLIILNYLEPDDFKEYTKNNHKNYWTLNNDTIYFINSDNAYTKESSTT